MNRHLLLANIEVHQFLPLPAHMDSPIPISTQYSKT